MRTINDRLKTTFADSELEEDAVIQEFRITAADGKTCDTTHDKPSAVIADGTASWSPAPSLPAGQNAPTRLVRAATAFFQWKRREPTMATGRGIQLTKQVGEFLVAAELGRRGWLGAVLSGNTPAFDLIATDSEGRSVPIQVKAITGRTWQFDAAKFVEIEFVGPRQSVGKARAFPPNLVCVMVKLGASSGFDRFFVLPMSTLQSIIAEDHQAWLARHGGVRPKNPTSTHTSVSIERLEAFQDRWEVIEATARRRHGLKAGV